MSALINTNPDGILAIPVISIGYYGTILITGNYNNGKQTDMNWWE
jgi:hypothetical protein